MSSLGSMMRQFSPPASSSLSSHFDLGQGVSSRKGSRDKRSIQVRAQRSGASVSDDYAALGMSPAASRRDIKAAYRRLALQYHPDVCKEPNCEHKFREINNAYEALMSRVQKGNGSENEELRWEDLFGESDMWDEWMGHEVGPIPTYAAAYSKSM